MQKQNLNTMKVQQMKFYAKRLQIPNSLRMKKTELQQVLRKLPQKMLNEGFMLDEEQDVEMHSIEQAISAMDIDECDEKIAPLDKMIVDAEEPVSPDVNNSNNQQMSNSIYIADQYNIQQAQQAQDSINQQLSTMNLDTNELNDAGWDEISESEL